MINLKKFCDPNRAGLSEPWSDGDFTYASNGRIIVRVPRRADVPERPEAPKHIEREKILVIPPDDAVWKMLPTYDEPPRIKCEHCGGGHNHRCDCGHDHTCESCRGLGSKANLVRVELNGLWPQQRVLAELCVLPHIEICRTANRNSLTFRFQQCAPSPSDLLVYGYGCFYASDKEKDE